MSFQERVLKYVLLKIFPKIMPTQLEIFSWTFLPIGIRERITIAKHLTLDSIKLDWVHWFQEVDIPILLALVQLPEENNALIFVFGLNHRWNLSLAHPSNSPHALHTEPTLAKATWILLKRCQICRQFQGLLALTEERLYKYSKLSVKTDGSMQKKLKMIDQFNGLTSIVLLSHCPMAA